MLLDDASTKSCFLPNLQCCKIVLYFGANNSKHNFYNIVPSGVQAPGSYLGAPS